MIFVASRRGFSLIELIVVVAIITLLAGVTLGVYSSSRTKSNDGERQEEIRAIALSFDLYRELNGAFPDCSGGVKIDPTDWGTLGAGSCSDLALIESHLLSTFGSIPSDPQGPGSDDYYYYYTSAQPCADPDSSDTSAVMVFAANLGMTSGSNLTDVCDSSGTTGNVGGLTNTAAVGGTINPSAPFVVIMRRF